MKLIYYRNFDPNNFLNSVDFNFSSTINITASHDLVLDEYKDPDYVKVRLPFSSNNESILFQGRTFLSDVKVIVGKNGIGKSSLMDDVVELMMQSRLDLSWQILIGDTFFLVGNKVKLEKSDYNKLKEELPALQLYVGNGVIKNAGIGVDGKVVLENRSLIQSINNGSALLFYANSIDSSRLNAFEGKLMSTAEIAEEGQRLFDISTLNRMVQSSKWGLDSAPLYETLHRNNLIAYGDYELRILLDKYFSSDSFKRSIPKEILKKLEVQFVLGSLSNQFKELVFNLLPISYIAERFPSYYKLSNDFKSNSGGKLIVEFLISLLLKLIDKRVNLEEGLCIELVRCLTDLEKAIQKSGVEFSSGKSYSITDSRKILDAYVNNSKLLRHFDSLKYLAYSNFNDLLHFILEAPELRGQFVVNSIAHHGLTLSLDEDTKILHELYKRISNLISNKDFQIPFIHLNAKNLSTGEHNMLYFYARLIYVIDAMDSNAEGIKKVSILMDEPGNNYHPEWQKKYFNKLFDFISFYDKNINRIEVQFIISTHSPFLLSDFSPPHILKLDRSNNKTDSIAQTKPTFGTNLFDLLHDSFYLNSGFIGDFASNEINSVLTFITEGDNPDDRWNAYKAKQLIEIIGDEMLKNTLKELYAENPELVTDDELESELNRITDEIKRRKDKKHGK